MAVSRDHILGAMRNHGLVLFIFMALTLFGIISLPKMNKDEFPQFTIRQGVVVGIYPGATAQEVEEHVTGQIEEYINSFAEVDKANTYSVTEDGIVYVYVQLRNTATNSQEVWTRMRAGLDLVKKTRLPEGLLQIAVIDDFGNTSSMLLAVESAERSPRELETYAQQLCTRLRSIPEMGNIRILGQQQEEIAVTIDPVRLAAYGIDRKSLQLSMLLQGLRTLSGTTNEQELQVALPLMSEYEVAEQIVWIDPTRNAAIRLKDIAHIERRYQHPDKYVEHYEEGERSSSLIINIEMVPGNNIVAFGSKVEQVLNQARADMPQDLRFHRITDQPKVVNDSVVSFLRDIIISILVVILVMLVLFPLRTALVASTGLPICTAICIGLMYLTGIELNTVTLAALIFVLGMIVDDSVIVIDGYTNLLEKGHSRWYSAAVSTKQLFVPMTLATCSISGMFFPMTKIITGPLGEFVQLFPYAVLFALVASIFYATWVTPYLSTRFIRRRKEDLNAFERGQNRFFSALLTGYERILRRCFHRPVIVYGLLIAAMAMGIFFLTQLNLQLLPKAEREFFAVEIHLREGAPIEETAAVTDSLARILIGDERVNSVTSFVGQASPRFHATYTPQIAKSSYAQFIVNTTGQKATAAILREYTARYENHFPNTYIRFKQLDYQAARNPIEVFIQGEDIDELLPIADTIRQYMASMPCLAWVHTDYEEYTRQVRIDLRRDEAARLGITETQLSLYLSGITHGAKLTTLWEQQNAIPVMLYTQGADSMSIDELSDLQVPTAYPGVWVPLRQVATLSPNWHHSSIGHRNGKRTITIGADLRGNASQVTAENEIRRWIKERGLVNADAMFNGENSVSISYGGLSAINDQLIPQILWSVVAALLVMFVLLLYHFGKVSLALLALSSSLLTIFGAFLGLWLFGLDISITAVLGIVSLIGIIVRNAIMMYEYAEELQRTHHLSVRDAAFEAGMRRMRPVFLTSATTALGVLPMIIAHTSLWMPMGVVICFGTIFTLPLTITILPVIYWKIYEKK